MKEEESKDEKGLPPLTDEERVALEAASDVNNTEGVTTEQKQRPGRSKKETVQVNVY